MSDPRDALDAIGTLPDTEIDIGDAALQFARIDAPEANWEAARVHLSDLARAASALAETIDETDLAARAVGLSGLLGARFGYRGDHETYDDLANANLIRVIERRRGLPVALGVLWLHTAHAAGWAAHGVDFPAHFLVAMPGPGGQSVLDVFHGGTPLTSKDLRALLKRVEGVAAEIRPGLLRPMNARRVLLRLQNNILTRRLTANDVEGALACGEDMLRVAPDHASLWHQVALLNQKLDRIGAALRCFDRFLALVPEGEVAREARLAAGALRGRLN
ncbi:MAG: tetratricopeptide repeat protein [Acetobacteraceae bacterium]|nr:tetratricopeptide repeat protein [Acetobacteraceae bacterium]